MKAGHLALLFVFLCHPLFAQWPDRHGPTLDGHVSKEHAENLPVHWDATTNIVWRTPLHDEGHSSPVILEGKVWLTSATSDGRQQFVICVDESTGEVLHDKLIFENDEVEPLGGANGFNNYAAPSCVLAPGAVFVHFGSYGTACLDPETADIKWQRRDLQCRHYRGPGSSPVLYRNNLILTFDGVDQQYTTVLNSETGETIWRTDRSTDYEDLDEQGQPLRDGDLRKAYCTPGIAEVNGRPQILSVGSRAMHSYDLQTGKELWTIRHSNFNAGVRPLWLPEEGLAVFNTGSRGAHLIAVKLDQSTKGDVTDSHVVWEQDKGNPQFVMPVYFRGMLFQVNDSGVAACIAASNGKELWKKRISGDYLGSPILAGDRLYFFSKEGRATVLEAADRYQEIAVNVLPEMGTTACPAVSNGAIFVRGQQELFKICNSSVD